MMDYIELIKNNEEYRQDLLTRLIYHSNRIEGTTLTLGETDVILWEKEVPVKASARDFYDVTNHKRAIEFLLHTIDETLSLNIIRQLGILINENINEIDGFRNVGVIVRGSQDMPPKPAEVPTLMMQLLDNYTYACKEATMSSVEREAWFHLKYEQIHPFIDGNGRTGRLLMFRGLLKDGMPPFVMNSDSRAKYIDIVSTQDKEGLMSLIEESCKNEETRVSQLRA